jgi:hypothetical protein
VLHPETLEAATLRSRIQAALATSRAQVRQHVEAALSFDGARRAAQELLALARAEAPALEALTAAAT